MDDRVGELLARRAAMDSGPLPAIAISVLLHGGVAAGAIYAAMHTPAIAAPQQVLNIRLAPVQSAAPAMSTPITPAAAPPQPPHPPRIEPPKPKPEDVKPSTAPPVPNAVPLSPFGRSSKKGAENPVVKPPASTASSPATGTAAQPQEAVGIAGIEGGEFPYTIYIERMKTLIGQHWLRPQISGTPVATVYFVIERDGSVRDVRVETPSNVPAFDRAAQRAILESSPLPPLPFGYAGTYLGVHLKFQ